LGTPLREADARAAADARARLREAEVLPDFDFWLGIVERF
jgi:hypothetical protein